MKKILFFFTCVLSIIVLAACSSSGSSVDNGSATERLGTEWYAKDGYEYKIYLNDSEEIEGAHFLMAIDEKSSELVRSHFVPLSKKQIGDGEVGVQYASPRAAKLTNFQSQIEKVISDNKDLINEKLGSTDLSVQATWEQKYTVPVEDNYGLFIEYLPVRFNYYSGADRDKTGVLYTYVLVPVRVIATTYTVENEKYSFADETANSLKDTLIDWTADKYGQIK